MGKPTRSSRRRIRRHDPTFIRKLLAERRSTGESYASIAQRTGIPVGTLGWWSHRERQHPEGSGFVEVRVRDDVSPAPAESPTFKVVVAVGDRSREVLVPTGFDEGELRRLILALEAAC